MFTVREDPGQGSLGALPGSFPASGSICGFWFGFLILFLKEELLKKYYFFKKI